MHKVISSIKDFQKDFPQTPKEGVRIESLKRYFAIHGVIKAIPNNKDWPKLVYPNPQVLETKIKDTINKKKIYSEKLNEWKKQHFSATIYHQVNQVKKFAEPVYWQHLAKTITDSDYRKDADSVKLPVHLVSDKKWKPMVKTFVNDIEYRKQLTETVNTSIIYKKNKKVAKYADDLQGFRKTTADKQVKELEEKILELTKTEKALREMQNWARE